MPIQVREALSDQGLLVGPLSEWERYEPLASAVVRALAGGRSLTSTQVDGLVRKASAGSKTSQKRVLKSGGCWTRVTGVGSGRVLSRIQRLCIPGPRQLLCRRANSASAMGPPI